MTVFPETAHLAVNVPLPFTGSGGTGPYTYAVAPDGAGGTIDGTTGVYTAPASPALNDGVDTIVVTDSLGETAQAQALVGTYHQLVCDIIAQEMGIDPSRVYLWDQKINEPKDQDIFVVLSIVDTKVFGNTLRPDGSGAGLAAIQSVNVRDIIDIAIKSRGPAARERKEEVVMSLQSIYSEQQQELNSFRVFPYSKTFVNLSEIDGAAIPYRFNISVSLQYMVTKTKAAPYFDTFSPVSVITDD